MPAKKKQKKKEKKNPAFPPDDDVGGFGNGNFFVVLQTLLKLVEPCRLANISRLGGWV